MRDWRCVVPLLAALVALTWSATASAAPVVTWDAPPGCPTVDRVLESFALMHVDAAKTEELEANGRVVREGDVFVLALSLRSGRASNDLQLSERRCETLADVVALELALAADSRAVTSSMAARAPGTEPGANRWVVGLAAGGASAWLPALAVGVQAAVAFDTSVLRLELDGSYFGPRNAYYGASAADAGARFDAFAGAVRVCSSAPRRGFGLGACAGFEAGGLRGVGFGLEPTYTSIGFWGALTASPVIRWAFGPALTLFAEAEMDIAVARPEFHARNLGTLFRPDEAGAALWLGAETSL
jgi:hypothetical protein